MTSDIETTVAQLKETLDAGHDVQLVDVREMWEFAIVHLPGSILLPMHDLGARLGEADRTRPTVIICHHGIRSLHAALALRGRGFTDVRSLRGGIERWATEIDPTMPRY
jgi:rhodanese-related sulfurtransferase